MKIAILSANLGSFDTNTQDPIEQELPDGVTDIVFHRFTDEDFPPISGLTGRLQYRIPKLFGWEMFPGYDIYIWLDSSMSFKRPDCVKWFMMQLGKADSAFFRHPQRGTIKAESNHIEEKLQQNNWYIVPRYKNGLHKEFVNMMEKEYPMYKDDTLYASTVFIYRNTPDMQYAFKFWWYMQSRYYTCDQIHLPLVLGWSDIKVNKIQENLFKIGYCSLVTHHK